MTALDDDHSHETMILNSTDGRLTHHLSWKNSTGFPFQNVLSIQSLVCVSMLYMVLALLISLNGYTPSRTLIALLLTLAC